MIKAVHQTPFNHSCLHLTVTDSSIQSTMGYLFPFFRGYSASWHLYILIIGSYFYDITKRFSWRMHLSPTVTHLPLRFGIKFNLETALILCKIYVIMRTSISFLHNIIITIVLIFVLRPKCKCIIIINPLHYNHIKKVSIF